MKIAVAQLGARRHYQQPILLQEWELLDMLYTDFYSGDRLPFNLLRHPRLKTHLPATLKRMLDRHSPALKGAKVSHFPMLAYQYARTLKQLKGQNTSPVFVEAGKAFCQRIIQRGLGEADTVYGFNGACLELFKHAKQQGLYCILDQTLAERFYYYQLMQTEEVHWPGWSIAPVRLVAPDRELAEREQQEQDLADHIICGSSFVKDSLMTRGLSAKKITVVPLGRVKEAAPLANSLSLVKSSCFPWKNRPEGLHILFAGSVGLRKGVPYLLEALRQLKGRIPFVCKAAGSIQLRSEVLEHYSDVCQFLGQVPRFDMAELYRWADVFVLPSLCEGSAMVTFEALQYGLPLIVTPNTGSIVRDGIDGSIVPIRDASAIAESLLHRFEEGYAPTFVDQVHSHLQQTRATALANLKQVVVKPDFVLVKP